MIRNLLHAFFFFFNDTATTEIYTLSLHDALPISEAAIAHRVLGQILLVIVLGEIEWRRVQDLGRDRAAILFRRRSEEHTSELQSPCNLVCRLLLEKKKKQNIHLN